MGASELPAWADRLDLRPHPEGGWFTETYRAGTSISVGALPPGYDGPRPLATAIMFLLLPGEHSAWHVVRSDELWIHQRGGPLVLGLGGSDPSGPGPSSEFVLGTEGTPEQAPQRLVPAGVWQTARPAGDEPTLVACVVVPGFDYADWRLADPA